MSLIAALEALVEAGATPEMTHAGERSQVVTPSLPSLRSEELKPPVSPNGLTAPKGSEKRSRDTVAGKTGLRP
jgi:hypothetical protein